MKTFRNPSVLQNIQLERFSIVLYTAQTITVFIYLPRMDSHAYVQCAHTPLSKARDGTEVGDRREERTRASGILMGEGMAKGALAPL